MNPFDRLRQRPSKPRQPKPRRPRTPGAKPPLAMALEPRFLLDAAAVATGAEAAADQAAQQMAQGDGDHGAGSDDGFEAQSLAIAPTAFNSLASDGFNADPTVANTIPNQNATEDAAFDFQFAADTFNDADIDDTLTYTAQLASGGALPAWLSFDYVTRTFSGTPSNADVGTITIRVTADDGNGGTAATHFDIAVVNTNDAPVVADPIPDQVATESEPFHFKFDIRAFTDIDAGDTLTYSARLASGDALPGWLSFDAATRVFLGTPSDGDVGTSSIRVTADDGNGGSVSDVFDLTVRNTGSANVVYETSGPSTDTSVIGAGIPLFQSFHHDSAGATYTIDSVALQLVRDPGASLQTITATLLSGAHDGAVIGVATISSASIGTTLAWRSFDFTNTVLSDNQLYFLRIESSSDDGLVKAGIHEVDVYPNGSYHASSGAPDTSRDIAFMIVAGANTPPTLANPIPDQSATEDATFNFQFAANTFNDADIDDTLAYMATLANGDALPAWLSFNAATRTFNGTPSNADVGTITIRVIADDGNGGEVAVSAFDITVVNTNDAPTVVNPIPNQNATEDSAFNFRFAVDTFLDSDAGDTLSYSAQLAGGGALPAWLSFDAATRTFSGTPSNDDVGTVSIDVIANDGNGGTVTDTFSIVVANTNDAPTVANAIPNQNATENVAFGFQFAINTFADVDVGDALTYSAQLAGGGPLPAWLSFDAVTRAFSGTPSNADTGTISISVIASDGNGGTVTDTFDIDIANVNDAPTLSGGPFNLAGTNEDTASNGTLVSTILAGLTTSDPDGPNSGIAITASSGNGTWQYSTDGVTWTSVGSVSNSAALMLSASTQLRYIPDGQNGETATLTFRAWDQSLGTASTNSTRDTADTSTNGGSTAFSTGTAQASMTVGSVNDAPVLTPASPTLTGITDSDTNNAGQSVASVLGGSVSDVDSGALSGIAITGTDPGNGTWQYSLDDGASWQNMGTVSTGSALLLRSTDRVRFVPDGVNGTMASISYRAWDQSGTSNGQYGSKVNASIAGGSTPFSAASDTASVMVTAVNDAPMLTTSGGSAAFIEGDNETSTPVVIDAGITVADSDSALLYGATVQITGNLQNAQDVLGFTNDGATMGDISASYDSVTGTLTLTSAGGASAAQWQAALRAVTYGNSSENPNTGSRTISFVINDSSLDSNPAQRTVTVTSVNDAPVVTMPVGLTVDEDIASAITGISFADVDAGAGSVTVTLSVPAGTLSAASGGGVAVGGSASAMTLTGAISDINAFIAGGNVSYQGALNSTDSVTLTASINDSGLSGGAPRTSSDTVSITITPVNDAPVVNAPATLFVTEDVPYELTGISFTDVDIGSGTATVQLVASAGTLDGVSGGGVTVTGAGTGSVTLQGTLADINAYLAAGNLSYTTALDATANATLQIEISDGSLTDSTMVTLQVIAQNDAPVNSVPNTQSVPQDGGLVFSTANGNAISISDVDAGGGIVQVTLTATQGLLSLSGTAGLTFIVGSGSDDITTTFTGSIDDINNALQGLGFTPNAGYTGAASLQIVTNDLGLSGNGGNRSDSDTILITVAPPDPTIVSVQAGSPDGTYKVGDTVNITATFDQPVTVSGGIPSLLLETGAVDRSATYVDGSGSHVLTFAYVVQAGDQSSDLDYVNTGALVLNGATIASVGHGSPSVNTLALPGAADSLGANAALVIDGVVPTASIVVSDPMLTGGETSTVTITFSEAVSGLSLGDFIVANGTLGNLNSRDGGVTWTATLTPLPGVSAATNVITLSAASYTDIAGNSGSGATSGNYAIHTTTALGATLTLDDTALAAGETATVTIAFTEAVAGLALDDFSVRNGTLANLSSSDGGRTWSATLTPAAATESSDNHIVLNLAGVTDGAGNAGEGSVQSDSYAVDTVAPRYTLATGERSGDEVPFTVTFSEPVEQVDVSDFVLTSHGSISGEITALTRVDDRTWIVTVGGVAGAGTLTLDVAATRDIADRTGNPLATGSGASHTSALPPPPLPLPLVQPPVFTDTGLPFTAPSLIGNFEVPSLAAPAPLLTVTGSASTSLLAGFASPATGGNALGTGAPPSLVTAPLVSGNGSTFAAASEAPGLTPPNNLALPLDTMSAHFIQTGERTSGSGLQATPDLGRHTIAAGQPLTVTLPRGTFTHDDASALITVTARLKDGRPLPNWLRFDPRTGTLSGQPPAGYRGTLQIELTGRDSRGNQVSSSLQIDVREARSPQAEHAPVATDRFTALWQALGRERTEIDSHERADIDSIDAPPTLPGFAAQLAAEASAAEREAARLADALQRHLAG